MLPLLQPSTAGATEPYGSRGWGHPRPQAAGCAAPVHFSATVVIYIRCKANMDWRETAAGG